MQQPILLGRAYNRPNLMITTRRTLCLSLLCLSVSLAPAQQQSGKKRPLTHADYDAWRSISAQRISPDGKYVAYGSFPQVGDGDVIIHDVAAGADLLREPAGARPAPAAPDPEAGENAAPPQRTTTIQFTADSRYCIFTTFPSKAATDAARRARKPAAEMPKGGLVIVNLATRQVTRIADVKGFELAEDDSTFVAYHKEAPAVATDAAKPAEEDDGEDQRAGARPAAAASARGAATGSPLILRNLKDATERTFADVAEYTISRNGKALLFAVASRQQPEKNGAFAVATTSADAPFALLEGRGRYTRLTWDRDQRRVAFTTTNGDAQARQPKWRILVASLPANASAEPLALSLAVAERGNLNFSSDGSRLFFPVAPPAKQTAPRPADPDDVAGYDLWHYQDDFIQPMQKSRAAQERNRTYRAAYLIAERKAVTLTDATLAEISMPDAGRFAFGSDDRPYRRMVEYDRRYADIYAIDTTTGERKRIASKQAGPNLWSHTGTHAIHFDGEHWHVIAAASGERINLTGKIAAKFFNEEDDHPSTPPAYGFGGWLRDGKSVLLYDRYDVWQVAVNGSQPVNLTGGLGRAEGIQFRAVRLASEDPQDRGIDSTKPLLLRAEKLATRESGFYRVRFGSPSRPEKLILEAKSFSIPVKAKNSDVLLFTASKFDQFPDLQVSDLSFRSVRKISALGEQLDAFSWGTSELIRFRSTDGTPLQATLYKPANFDPKKKYPLLVYIYERLSQGVHTFVEPRPMHSVNTSLYTSNGYLVLQPDIAYRVGYPGPSALQCVLPAIDAVSDLGFVDQNAIGIQGHSWGGYQIAYMVTQTRRFKAAAAGAPVANMFSAYNGIRWGPGLPRQFQYERTQSRIGGTPWQYPLRFLENSPVFHIDQVSTPLLLLHNDADDAVPWYQGIEMFLALRRLGKEAYMFTYNGEPHGIRKRANQKDYARRLLDFFDHQLKNAPKPQWMVEGRPYLDKEPAPATESPN